MGSQSMIKEVTDMARNGYAFLGKHNCAVFEAEQQCTGKHSLESCKINPGHAKFMAVDEFKQKGPDLYPDDEEFYCVMNKIDRTGRVKVTQTSSLRPPTYPKSDIPYPMYEYRGSAYVRCGTGYLCRCVNLADIGVQINKFDPCSCLKCNEIGAQKAKPMHSTYFIVTTATHVVFDDWEARKTIFELSYDSEDKRNDVVSVYGVLLYGDEIKRLNTDTCFVLCVTHDEKLAEKLREIIVRSNVALTSWLRRFLISHPHGMCKRISFGEIAGVTCVVVQKNPSEIKVKKGTQVRISGDWEKVDDVKKMLGFRFENDDDNDKKGVDESDVGDVASGSKNSGCSRGEVDDGPRAQALQSHTPASSKHGNDMYTTFRLSSDVSIRCQSAISLATTIHRNDVNKLDWVSFTEARWWSFPPGTTFVTESGATFSLPKYAGEENSDTPVQKDAFATEKDGESIGKEGEIASSSGESRKKYVQRSGNYNVRIDAFGERFDKDEENVDENDEVAYKYEGFIDKSNERFDTHEEKVGKDEERFDKHEKSFDNAEGRHTKYVEKFDKQDRLKQQEGGLEKQNKTFDKDEERFAPGIQIEAFIEGYLDKSTALCDVQNEATPAFLDSNSYAYFNHNMAACPGSSGAMFYHESKEWLYGIRYDVTHFGCFGCYNRTGLLQEVNREKDDRNEAAEACSDVGGGHDVEDVGRGGIKVRSDDGGDGGGVNGDDVVIGACSGLDDKDTEEPKPKRPRLF